MNAAEKRILLPLLKRVKAGETPSFRMRSAAEHLIYRFSKPASKSKKAARVRKEGKAATHRESMGHIREAVLQRAAGRCENPRCGVAFIAPVTAEMDHWLSGGGRRREKQSVETCWMLCWVCHKDRTANIPSAAWWNSAFAAHCARYGYPFQAHIEKEIPCPSP
jgi:hypothetical protein